MTGKRKNWLLAGLLTMPMLIFFASYLFHHPHDLIPTGFIQYDNAGYVAYAKQYLDSDRFSFFYSNPFNDSGNYTPVYFQTQSILFAIAMKAGIPPGAILIPFTLLCSFFCFRLLIAIFDHLVPQAVYRTLSIIFFSWGGGLLVAGGLFYNAVSGQHLWHNMFTVDPAGGWWGLNFGRSLFFSCEAYYHLLFLAVTWCILKQKWLFALFAALLLSISHPFTGIELLSILCAWLFIEKILLKNRGIPWFFATGILLTFTFHIWYYLFYLNQFSDHRSVSSQYALDWHIRIARMIPAYAITGTLAVMTLAKLKRQFFANSVNRFFVCWFIVALLLAKHELFMKPMQPVHFTRGYIWTGLFLIGIPALQSLFDRIRASRFRIHILAAFSFFFLLDNFVWIMRYSISGNKSKSATYITREEKDVLDTLKKYSGNRTLIVAYGSEEDVIPYLATVHTAAYPWISHPFTTPFIGQKREAYRLFIEQGMIDASWRNRDVIFIFRKPVAPEMKRANSLSFQAHILMETPSYRVMAARITS